MPGSTRRSVRLEGYDYARAGAYFVTVCTAGRACNLADIVNGDVRLSPLGGIVRESWLAIPDHYSTVHIDAFIVMPNHLHGVLVFRDTDSVPEGRGTIYRAPTNVRRFGTNQAGSLADVVGKFKAAVTREAKRTGASPAAPVWQRNYHEHIIRNEADLDRIRQYIADNPARWHEDEYFAVPP